MSKVPSKGYKRTVERRGQQVIEIVEGVTKVPIMAPVLHKDPATGDEVPTFRTDPETGERFQVEKKVGTATHIHSRWEWPDGAVTHVTSSVEAFNAEED